MLAALDAASQAFGDLRWDDTFLDVLDNPPRPKTFGGAIGHVLTHNMHHRAQAMFIMEQLGPRDHLEGDLLTWENRVYWPAHPRQQPYGCISYWGRVTLDWMVHGLPAPGWAGYTYLFNSGTSGTSGFNGKNGKTSGTGGEQKCTDIMLCVLDRQRLGTKVKCAQP